MAACIRPMPGQLWRPTREGSRAVPRLIEAQAHGYVSFMADGRQSDISLTGWYAWVRMHAAKGELHTGDP